MILVVNKAEGLSAVAAAEFYELGFGEPWLISAAHGQGVNAVMGPRPRGLRGGARG